MRAATTSRRTSGYDRLQRTRFPPNALPYQAAQEWSALNLQQREELLGLLRLRTPSRVIVERALDYAGRQLGSCWIVTCDECGRSRRVAPNRPAARFCPNCQLTRKRGRP